MNRPSLPVHGRGLGGGAYGSFVDALRTQLRTRAERTALIFLPDGENEGERLTYAALDERARALAAFLQAQELAQQRVLLMLPSSVEYVVAFLGCLYAGAIAVPVYPSLFGKHVERLLRVARDCDARAAFYLKSAVKQERSQARFDEIVSSCSPCEFFALDELSLAGAGQWVEPRLEGSTPAFLQYTSGSTGHPRGVVVTHGNISANMKHIHDFWVESAKDVFVTWLPLHHDMGIGSILEPLYAGATNVVMPPLAFLQKPLRWLRAISNYKAAFCVAPNFAFDLCVRASENADLQGLDLSSWQSAANGSEPIRAETLDRFTERFAPFGFRATTHLPGYGLAEATMGVSYTPRGATWRRLPVDAEALRKSKLAPGIASDTTQTLVGCGQVHPENTILIVDPETRKVCADGAVGEIWIAGPTVTAGYWNKPEETKAYFGAYTDTGAGPFLRSGDLGALHDGVLYVTGRQKDLIIVRGANHYPQDIEHTVQASHPALHGMRGAAFSLEQDGEERVVILQEVDRAHVNHLDGEDVVRALQRAVFEAHGLDVHAAALLRPGALPVTSSGKIQRRESRQQYLANALKPVFVKHDVAPSKSNASVYVAPTTDTEKTVAVLMAETLGVEHVGLHDDFFALGGQSLLATQLISKLRNAFALELTIGDLLDACTVAQISERIGVMQTLRAQRSQTDAPSEDWVEVRL